MSKPLLEQPGWEDDDTLNQLVELRRADVRLREHGQQHQPAGQDCCPTCGQPVLSEEDRRAIAEDAYRERTEDAAS